MNAERSVKTKYSLGGLLRDLSPFIKPYRGRLLAASGFRVMGDLAWLYATYALASFVNFLAGYRPGDSFRPIWLIVITFAAVIIVRVLGHYSAKMIGRSTGERMALDAMTESAKHIFKLDMAWHERENAGGKLRKIERGGEGISRLTTIWINNVLGVAVSFAGAILIIAKFDPVIAGMTAIFLATYFFISFSFKNQGSKAAMLVSDQDEEVHGLLFQAINNIRSVKVLGMAEALGRIIKREIDDLFRKMKKRTFWFQTGEQIRWFWAQSVRLSILVFIVYGVVNGRYQIGFFVLFWSYFNLLTEAIREFTEVAPEYIIAKFGIRSMMGLLKEPVTIDLEEDKTKLPANWKIISFKDVSFSYDDNEVLKDISFEIKRGERVGVIGLSGAGKSTLFKLLLKEHENYSGEILIDDVPLTRISKEDYFKHTAAVLQDTEVFNFSLKDNIVLANIDEENNSDLLDKALKVSHVDDFVHKLPDGMGTLIGEKGIKLSGGERQRVGLARAVFKDPQLLLLDEATSHLDIESEEKIRASLHEFFQTVTAIVIAHRLTTIREMDKIIVIENGRIVEQGSFSELYDSKGRFYELWEKQKL